MPPTAPDFVRALDLARLSLAQADQAPAPSVSWARDEQLLVAHALLSVAKAAQHERAKALDEAARILDDLADREVMQPAMVGTYVRIAADIRALATAKRESDG
jgi:hypothetical protein